jgi:SSS family solute:Na+ symporter
MDDYYHRFKPSVSEKHHLMASRLFILIAGLGAIGIALIYIKTDIEGVLETVFALYAIFSGGIAGMFLLGIFSKKANKQGLYIGISASILFTAWAVLTSLQTGSVGNKELLLDLGKLNYMHHEYMIGVYSHIIVIVVGYFASLFFKGIPPEERLMFTGYLKYKRQTGIN